MNLYKTAGEAKSEVRSTGQTGVLPDDKPRMEPTRQAIQPPANNQPVAQAQTAQSSDAQFWDDYFSQQSGAANAEPSPAQAADQKFWDDYFGTQQTQNTPVAQPAAKEEPGLLSDASNLLGMGADSMALNVRELVYRFAPNVAKKIDAIDEWFSGKNSEQLLKESTKAHRAALSTATREASDKDWWDSEKGQLGEAWSDPRSYMSGVLQSLPEQTLTMFPAMRLAKGIYTAKLAAKATPEVAAAAASRAAAWAGGISEGLLAGAASSREVRDRVLEIPLEKLEESDAYRTMVLNGMTPDQARQNLANDVATQAFVTSGLITGAFGGMGDKVLGEAITKGLSKSFVGRVGKGMFAEGVLEEFPQEYGASVAENVAMQKADPSVGATDNALNRALGGLATGAVQGGAMTGVLGKKEGSATANATNTQTTQDNTSTDTADPNAQITSDQEQLTRQQFAMTDDEFTAVSQDARVMAALYDAADPQTQALLRQANPLVDIEGLAADSDLVAQGRQIVDANPEFISAFVERLASPPMPQSTTTINGSTTVNGQDTTDAADVPFVASDTTDNPAPRFTPNKANMREAGRLAQTGIDMAEEGWSQDAPQDPNNEGETTTFDRGDDVPQDVLLRGFQRRAQNISSLPDAARRAAATSAIEDMIGRGFTVDQAQAVFGVYLKPGGANQNSSSSQGGAGGTGTNSGTDTVSQRLQTFNKIRQDVVQHDQAQWGVNSTEADYSPANLTPALYKLAEALGVNVVGFRYNGKDPKMARRSGVSTPNGIALNVASKDQWLAIFGHEVYHALVKRDPQAARELQAAVLAYINDSTNTSIRQKLEAVGYKPEKINEEMVADIMGLMFRDQQFWELVGKQKPTLLQRIIRAIDDLISRFGDTPGRNAELAKGIKDLQAVRNMMAQYLTESLDKQGATTAVDDAIEVDTNDPVGQFNRLAQEGSKAAAAKVFNVAKLRGQLGDFNQAYATAEQQAPASTSGTTQQTGTQNVSTPPVSETKLSETAKTAISQLYREKTQATVGMSKIAQYNTLEGYAKDLEEYGFSRPEIEEILQGTEEVIDSSTLKSYNRQFGYVFPKEGAAPAVRPSKENPNVMEGTIQTPIADEPTDAGTAPQSTWLRKKQLEQRAAQASRTYSDGAARALMNKENRDPATPDAEYLVSLDGQTIGKVFEMNGKHYSFKIKPDQTFSKSEGDTLETALNAFPSDATVTRVEQRTPSQTEMDLYGNQEQVNKYKVELQRLMTTAFTPSRAEAELADLRDDLDRKLKQSGNKRSDVEYIFDAFEGKSYASEFAPIDSAASAPKLPANDVEAIQAAIDRLSARDLKTRALALRNRADNMLSAIQDLRQRMADDGMSEQQINEIVGQAEQSLMDVRDSKADQTLSDSMQELADRVSALGNLNPEEQSAEIEAILKAKAEFDQSMAEQDPAPAVDEDTAALPSKDFQESRKAAAAAVDEIVKEGTSPMAILRRELNKPDRQFSFSDLRKELAARGLDLTQMDREIAQWPAAQYSLEYYVRKHAGLMSPYAARTTWFNSHEQIMAIYKDEPAMRQQFESELSEVEQRFIEKMREERSAVRNRRTEAFDVTGQPLVSAKEVFPHALFNKYSLADMRDAENANIPEDELNILGSLVGGNLQLLPKLWLDDAAYAMDARPDLRYDIMDNMSKPESTALVQYMQASATVTAKNQRIKALDNFSTALDGIGELDADAYNAFKAQIAYADVRAIPGILQRAQELASITALAKSRKELNDILDAYLDRVFINDESRSETLDESKERFDKIADGKSPSITDEEIEAYQSMLDRQGGGFVDKDTARSILSYQKIAESVAAEQQGEMRLNENETAAPETDSPESQAGLSGDIQYKRGRYSSGPAAATVQAHIEEITFGWKHKPNVQVFYNIDQITDPELKARLTERAEAGSFKGAIDPDSGAVYIFSQHVEDVADAEFVLFHELYGHWGLRRFLGDKLNAFLENQYRLNKKVKAEADRQYDEALESGAPMSRIESIEEAISDMATKGEVNLFRQLIGQLTAWLRKHNMNTVADWMDSTGASELAFVLSRARHVARTGQGIAPMNGAPSGVLYARNRNPVEVFSVRDGKVTGYARINPVNGYWTVFTIDDIATGSYGAVTVEDMEDVTAILKKVGKLAKSAGRDTQRDIDPNKLHHIPDYSDLKGWAKFKRTLQTGIQNTFLPIYEVAKFLDSKGIKSTVIDDILKYEARLGHFVKHYEKNYVNPIQRLLREAGKLGATVEEVDEFLAARTAKERNASIAAINPTNRAGSGMTDAEADKIMADVNAKPYAKQLNAIGQLTDQMSKDKLSYMLNTGLINKFQFASASRYKHYVNLSGNEATDLDEYDSASLGGKAFNLRGTDLIRATGRGTKAVDVLQNTMNAYLSTLMRGQKNRVVQAVLRMLEQNPDPTYARIEPLVERKRVNVDRLNFDKKILSAIGDAPDAQSGRKYLADLVRRIADGELDTDGAMAELTSKIVEAEQRRDISPVEAARAINNISERVVVDGALNPDGYVTMVEDKNLMGRDSVVVARVDGRPILIQFTDRAGEFVQSITGMNSQSPGGVVDAIGKWNRFFSLMVTTWNPAWLPINFIRDIQTAYTNAAADPEVGAALASKMAKEWMPSLRAAFSYTVRDQAEMKGKFSGKKLDPAYKQLIDEFYEDGAATFFLDRQGIEMTMDRINRHMNGPKGALQRAESALEVVGDFMDLLATPSELAPRLAAYKVLREAGWSRERASAYAKELTVNFNAKGSWKSLRALYVFANPAIQGTYRMFQDYSGDRNGVAKYLPAARFATTAAMWMMAGMISTYIARALGGEDDELPGVDKLDMIPDFRRATSLVFLPNVAGGSLPVAYGWNVFSAAGSYLLDAMTGKMKPEVAATKTLAAAFDSFAPLGSGAESKTLSGGLFKTFLPSPFVPLVEMSMNENRFGAPIHKEQNPFSSVSQANAYMHFDSVNPISKNLMQAISSLGARGNPKYQPGLLDVNPALVDHAIYSYLPGLFSEVYKAAGIAINKASGLEVESPKRPIVDRFNAKIPEGFDAGALRRVSETVSTMFAEYQNLNTSQERRAQILKNHPGLFTAYTIVNGESQRLKRVAANLQAIDGDPRYTEKSKIEYRNMVKREQKNAQRRMVQAALQAGFKDDIIDNRAPGLIGKVADRIRGE